MIKSSFNRLGTLVQNAIVEKLSQENYQVTFRRIMKEFQSNAPEKMFFRSGRAKLNDVFPNIGVEIQRRADKWAATSFTKDIQYEFTLFVAVKALEGPTKNSIGEINQVEDYCIALSEFVLEALNEPIDSLQYLLTENQDGKEIPIPIKIYDSLATTIQYGYLYNGALRIGSINWFAKVLRLGPDGGGQMGYGAPQP